MNRKTMLMLSAAAVLGAGVLGAGSLAVAQPGPRGAGGAGAPVYDPAQLPEIKGKVAQYSLTPRGEVDGLILADGTEVHVPPFVSTQLVFAVKPGDAVTVHGLKAKALPMVAARAVTNDATGAKVLVMSPRGMRGEAAQEAEGRIAAALHTPRGEVDGVRLEDGTLVRLPPGEAKRLADLLAPGKSLVVKGAGYSGPLGRSLVAFEVGPDRANLQKVARPRPGEGPGRRLRQMHGERHGHGWGGDEDHRPGWGPRRHMGPG